MVQKVRKVTRELLLKVTTARGADGRSTDITFTVPGEEPVVANIKDGKDRTHTNY